MYYRRKILLSLLQIFNNELDKISLQKLLFLLSCQQAEKSFHFVPYKYGCFSFQANADLGTLLKYNLVTETDNTWKKNNRVDYFKELKVKDQTALRYIKNCFGTYSKEELIKFTYRNFPFYAINSTILKTLVNPSEQEKIRKLKPSGQEIILFTIGYEGLSLEEYLNKLIINNIRVLCDARKNAVSMKYGFSKSQLQKACIGVGIEYIHIPELGIDSNKRQKLYTQADYDTLFDYYRTQVLKNEVSKQKEIVILLDRKKRVALTCFEANIFQCHRKHLAESIAQMEGFNYEVKHI